MVALLHLIAKRELETIKVEIPDFPFFSHQLIVQFLGSPMHKWESGSKNPEEYQNNFQTNLVQNGL